MADEQKTILLVDDDPDIIAATQMVLTAKGFNVITASHADEAMELLENLVPDMMVLDVMMRTLDEGFQLSYRIRGDERLKAVPILMLTSVSKETGFEFDPKDDGAWLPVQEFVEKPIDPQHLIATVNRLLELN